MYTQTPGENAIRTEVDGAEYWLDFENISLQQGIVIQGRMGMSIERLFERFSELVGEDGQGDANGEDKENLDLLRILHCFWWLMRAQSGIREPITECDGPMFRILAALLKGMAESGLVDEDTAAEALAPDPTPPSPPQDPPSPEPPGPRAPKSRSKPSPVPTG